MRAVMQFLSVAIATVCLYCSCCGLEFEEELEDEEDKSPSIGISILVRNKAHSLPYALTCLEQQEYPKERLFVWFYVDNTMDKSLSIIDEWTKVNQKKYNKIYVKLEKPTEQIEAWTDSGVWTEKRLKHVIQLRETAIQFARDRWADYLLMLDADVLLTDPKTLKSLLDKKLPIVAPMLVSDGLYSNFWGAMSNKYYYERTEQYEKITNREETGCFQVPMVHSAVLINLRTKVSDHLTYDPSKFKGYNGPIDDIIAFAISASWNDIPMSVCNDRDYGFIPIPVDMSDESETEKTDELEQLLNVKMEAISMGIEIPLSTEMARFVSYPNKDQLGLNKVYMINLERRTERRRIMDLSFKELGIKAELVKAVDGKKLDMTDLSYLSVTLMPNYEDPHHKRPMKAGEVGCFLSHYYIWKDIAKKHIPMSLVLEDDIHFTPFFRRRFMDLMQDLEVLDWDLVYIGRKVLQDDKENHVTSRLTFPLYSYWTIGYLISESGARKLIQAEPLSKMLPVDEFLPIMFNKHPNETWKSFFPRRDLLALSASPLLVFPTHYTGQPGYVSDTEDSAILPETTEPWGAFTTL